MDLKVVWAAVILMLGFFAFSGTLIISNHAADLRAFLLVMGQAVGFILNFWMLHRGVTRTVKVTGEVAQKTETAITKLEEVKEAVNGNIPPPGSMSKVKA
jgi:hypothetical protein